MTRVTVLGTALASIVVVATRHSSGARIQATQLSFSVSLQSLFMIGPENCICVLRGIRVWCRGQGICRKLSRRVLQISLTSVSSISVFALKLVRLKAVLTLFSVAFKTSVFSVQFVLRRVKAGS